MTRIEALKKLTAGQRLIIEGQEYVLQTARNFGALKNKNPEQVMALFRRQDTDAAWLVEVPADRSEASWKKACDLYGGTIPPVGAMLIPLPESLWVGDEFEIEDMRGLVYLSSDKPRLLVR